MLKLKYYSDFLVVLIFTMILFLIFDFFLGSIFLKYSPIKSRTDDIRGLRIKHSSYHHTLAPNYDGFGLWDNYEYRICTNQKNMKSPCNKKKEHKKYDIVFLGDSFVEGIGLTYEKTFVGIIDKKLQNKRIANLGVATYSPTIYFLRLKEFLENNNETKEVVVYVDISDIQDESNYQIVNGKVIDMHYKVEKDKTFPVIDFFYDRFINNSNKNTNSDIYLKTFRRAAWTIDDSDNGFGKLGLQKSIQKSINMMNKIYELCKNNNIKFSVGVYPWPTQILYDSPNSNHVLIWKEFCKGKCDAFYNSFPSFFKKKLGNSQEVVNTYYFQKDVHFNERGNEVLATDFLENYK